MAFDENNAFFRYSIYIQYLVRIFLDKRLIKLLFAQKKEEEDFSKLVYQEEQELFF